MTADMKWTEALVIDALRKRYEGWALMPQVPVGGRVLDALLLGDDPYTRIAIEVKTSRADYRSETDAKRAPAWQVAHRCLYAAPAGVIDPATLPYGWGLIEVTESGTALVESGDMHTPTIGLDEFTKAMLARASAAEDEIRRGDVPATETAKLRLENAALNQRLYNAQLARDREIRRSKAARSEMLAMEGAQECADCGLPITWERTGPQEAAWRHLDTRAEKTCQKARSEADRLRKERETGTSYAWGMPGEVEPRAIREARQAADLEDAQEAAL
jgi:hypothetical protein